MDTGMIVVASLVGLVLVILWILCRESKRREQLQEYWKHPPDSEVKFDEYPRE